MTRRSIGFLAAAGLAAAAAAQEPARDAAVVELRELISQVVDTQALESAERTGWQARKAEMSALLDLHRRELELLDEEIAQAGGSAGGYDERRKTAQAEIERLKTARRAASDAVARSASRMLAIAARFPAPLAKDCEAERLAIEGWKPGNEPREALQAILGMLGKAEQFNRRVTRSQEVRDGREVEVLYLGLARAFYADRSGNAGVGEPGEAGWSWQPRPELHGEISKAFATLDKRRPPAMIKLPVRIR